MTKTITQKIVFKNTDTKTLYNLYIDAKKHTEVTGDIAKISAKQGAKFSAFGNYITGKHLQLVKDKLIVQSWRDTDWKKADIDSTFILNFEQKGKDVVVHMTHANLPLHRAADINQGWHDYYWKPWKQYLDKK